MKAAVVTKPFTVEIQEMECPPAGPLDVCVKVAAAGVCGSDLHLFRGTHAFRKPPTVLGHEVAGQVVETGSAVTQFQPGDRVTVEPQVGCGKCVFCRDGHINLCPQKLVPGTSKWLGTFAEYFVAPEQTVYRLTDSVSYDVGSLAEPLAVAVHAVQMAGNNCKGKTMAILGSGTIGLCCLMVAQSMGYKAVYCTDTAPFNRALAERLGATAAFDPLKQDTVEAVLDVSQGGVDVVVVAAGAPRILDDASGIALKQGKIVLVSMITTPILVYSYGYVFKEQVLLGSMTYTSQDFAIACNLLAQGLAVGEIITHRLTLAQSQEALSILDKKHENTAKILIHP